MIRLSVVTEIGAPAQRCFDLSRSIELHLKSVPRTSEKAIAGVTSGLIGPGEEVTWQGRHFGLLLTHKSRITEYDAPRYFRDEMVEGTFRVFRHDHSFQEQANKTMMTDILQFESPLRPLGRLVDAFVLRNYLEKVLLQRNALIREIAETDAWKLYLP